jgi:glutathionylspermidine synthase
MHREAYGVQRTNWRKLILQDGLVYSPTAKPDGTIMDYWREGPYYSFTLADITCMEQASKTIFDMLIKAGDYIVANPEIMRKMGIPEYAWPQIIKSWDQEPAWGSVYGRYDIRFGGLDNPDPELRSPKLYEFNADTPTCLVEAAFAQWRWLRQTGQGHDQWNNISEQLVMAWRRNLELIEKTLGHKPVIHFTCSADEESGEDKMNTLMLLDTCKQAGYKVKSIYIENIVLGDDGRFYDEQGDHIDVIFKLYPWEFMVEQEFGRACFADMENIGRRDSAGKYIGGTIWIEPPYKMLWSNKGILAVLWQLFGNDDRSVFLIPTWFEGEQPKELRDYVKKPLLSREGANIITVRDWKVVGEEPGEYGAEGYIVQEFAPPPAFHTTEGIEYPVAGVWMIDGEPAGLGVRVSVNTHITDNLSHFFPHSISDGPNRNTPREPIKVVSTTPQDSPVALPAYARFNDPTFGRTH